MKHLFITFWQSVQNSFATPVGAVAQCIGFAAMILALFIYLFRERKTILISKCVADILWVLHYGLMGSYSGAAINFINTGREVVYYQKPKKKWASHRIWPLIFCLANCVSTVLTWKGAISILPAVGSSLGAVAAWFNKPTTIRLVVFPGIVLWLIYSILVVSPPSIFSNIFTLISLVIALCRDLLEYLHKKRCDAESAAASNE